MKFGLLCDDPAAANIIAALRQHPDHSLTRAVLVSPQADELLHGQAGVVCTERWEDLLVDDSVQAVLVGGTSPDVWEGARQLATDGVPLLIVPQLAGAGAMLYELSLIRDDRQGILFPAWLHRFDPAVLRLRDQLQAASDMTVTYAQWERNVPLGAGTELPRALIDAELFRDVDLWHGLFPATDQVTALRTGGTETGSLIHSVALCGRTIPELSWTIRSGTTHVSRLTLQTNRGIWVWTESAPEAGWSLTGELANPAKAETGPIPARSLIDAFAAAVAGQPDTGEWPRVLRAAEVVDAAQRSLLRRRTIDLHHEPLSERAIFKSQMAALGCSVLMLTLVLMLGFLAVGSVVPLDGRVLQIARVLIFTPLFLFLLLQLLFPLTRAPASRAK